MIHSAIQKIFIPWAKSAGLPVTEEQLSQLSAYLELILRYQEKTNLVGSSVPEVIVRDLLVDSLQVLTLDVRPAFPIIDIGSGAGLPGIPLKIFCLAEPVLLVEPRTQRYAFLRMVETQLKLENIQIFNCKVENLPENISWQSAISKAFAAPSKWLSMAEAWIAQGRDVYCLFSESDWGSEAIPWFQAHPLVKCRALKVVENRCFALLGKA